MRLKITYLVIFDDDDSSSFCGFYGFTQCPDDTTQADVRYAVRGAGSGRARLTSREQIYGGEVSRADVQWGVRG